MSASSSKLFALQWKAASAEPMQRANTSKGTFQFADKRTTAAAQAEIHSLVQRKVGENATLLAGTDTPALQSNKNGLPVPLQAGIEHLSGRSMQGVKVHYNSSKPAQLQAHAFAQGNNIHVGPGQEKHLPHEAWHAVQQAQGRVKPTLQLKAGVPVNDDKHLEREADRMGAKAMQFRLMPGVNLGKAPQPNAACQCASCSGCITQRVELSTTQPSAAGTAQASGGQQPLQRKSPPRATASGVILAPTKVQVMQQGPSVAQQGHGLEAYKSFQGSGHGQEVLQRVTVKNMTGTSGRKCSCSTGSKTWLGHWSRLTGDNIPNTCRAFRCRRNTEVGAHVKDVDGDQRTGYIVPFCQFHNKRPATTEIKLKSGTLLAPSAMSSCV